MWAFCLSVFVLSGGKGGDLNFLPVVSVSKRRGGREATQSDDSWCLGQKSNIAERLPDNLTEDGLAAYKACTDALTRQNRYMNEQEG